MFCRNCGKPLDDGAARCSSCGVETVDQPAPPIQSAAPDTCPACGESLTGPPAPPERGLQKRAFYKRYSKRRNLIKAAAVLCYVCAAFTLLIGLLGPLGLWSLLDVVILLVLGLGIQLFHSRVCAILLLLYALFSTIYMLIENGQLSGWLALIAAVFAIVGTFGFSGEWKRYCADSCGHEEDTRDAAV